VSKTNETEARAGKRAGRDSFERVLDSRKQPIKGLWKRRERFYARLNVEGVDTRMPLESLTMKGAKAELTSLRAKKQENQLRRETKAPKFEGVRDTYLKQATLTKRPGTMESERNHLKHLAKEFANSRLNQITKERVIRYRANKLGQGWSKRSCNLSVTVLRNLLKFAVDMGLLRDLPFDRVQSLKHVSPRKRLVDWTEVTRLCDAALGNVKKGRLFADYLRLMCLCGARRDETLRLRWCDVDWQQSLLTLGSDGLAKNHESRAVDFSTGLESHLRDMASRRDSDCEWLFPSARSKDGRVHTFKESLRIARSAAGITDFGFHHCRVFFASQCVMAGIDFRTIATWLGHKDGGTLLSRVYARLSDQHKRNMANRLVIGASQGDPEGTIPPIQPLSRDPGAPVAVTRDQ
jgi:integrase